MHGPGYVSGWSITWRTASRQTPWFASCSAIPLPGWSAASSSVVASTDLVSVFDLTAQVLLCLFGRPALGSLVLAGIGIQFPGRHQGSDGGVVLGIQRVTHCSLAGT